MQMSLYLYAEWGYHYYFKVQKVNIGKKNCIIR